MMVETWILEARAGASLRTVLRLPDLDQAKSGVLNSLSATDAQRGYRYAIESSSNGTARSRGSLSARASCSGFHPETQHLAPGAINLRLGAVRRLAYEASDWGLLSPDLAAGIRRVKGVKKIGVGRANVIAHSWLSCSPADFGGTKRSIWISVTSTAAEHWAIIDLKGKGRSYQNNTDARFG
jgi:hypothetical protein